MGDVTLLEDYGERRWAIGDDDTYLTFYVPCSESTEDAQGILQRIINSFSSITIDESPEASQLVDKTTTRRITLKPFQAEILRRYQVPDITPAYDDLANDEKLLGMASRLSEAYEQRILVIIDELDLVRETSGLASFIKNASSRDLKFLLVGIGQNVSSLISDHQSIERISVPIHVPIMPEAELIQIIDRAMERLGEEGFDYTFNRASSQMLARLASGFPWFVHVLGQAALQVAHKANRRTVTTDEVNSAVSSLVDSNLAQRFKDLYRTAVGESPNREMTLRVFALWPAQDIPTSEIYRVLKRLRIKNPSAYVSYLSSDSQVPIFMRPPLQRRGYVRFANEMFKVYVRVRRPHFDVDERIRNAWRIEFLRTEHADEAEPVVPA
jgi:histone H3/H4